MRESTRHRGPDDEGLWIDGAVGFAHNRLAILDLSSAGHQPMRDDETGNVVVYNGEIYNFREIRADLEARGCRFRSECDTEVLLLAWRTWGESSLERFIGMFAFALWDHRERKLVLVRDRIGIKPLYYYRDAHQLVFASETKAILRAPAVERRPDLDALPELVAFRYLAGGRTLLDGVRELEPGHLVVAAAAGGVRERRWWDVPDRVEEPALAPQRFLEGLEERLARGVRYRLIADVPVGCALSGGVDSSLVTALACEAATSTMRSFTIGFAEPDVDERPYARAVADQLGIENHSLELGEAEFHERLPLLTWHMDEPINHPNSVGIWLLAKLAREKVTVLLSGEGGDELMGGYDRFRTVQRLASLRERWRGIGFLVPMLARVLHGRPARVARELARDPDGALIWSSAYLPSPQVERLFGSDATERVEVERRRILRDAPRDDAINRHLYYELKTYLVSLLIRIDKMCMAHSLENRVPLLDHNVVEYSFRAPGSLKVGAQGGKIPLRILVEKRLGAESFRRRKMGFAPPDAFFRQRGLERLRELLAGRSFRERGWVEGRALDGLLADYEHNTELSPDSVWILGGLELWARTFVDRPGELVA
jgi:asparagine synthase (glutamine-hydrolysing)